MKTHEVDVGENKFGFDDSTSFLQDVERLYIVVVFTISSVSVM